MATRIGIADFADEVDHHGDPAGRIRTLTVDIPETRFVVTEDGLHIGYQVFGAGPYDLVFNDVLSNVDANWDVPSWAATLRAFGRRARVITFDRRGFGVSDRPASPDSLSLELGVDDLRAVMDAAGATRPVMMGFEWGCALSLLFAASYPERTAGLVLLSPGVYYWRTPEHPWGWSVDEADRAAQRDIDWGSTEVWRASLREMGIVDPDDAEARAWAKWARLVASPLARRAIRRVEQQTDVRSLLPGIQVPTLVLQKAGDHDRSGGGAAPWVASQIPGARFLIVPGPEDWPTARDTELFDAIDGFAGEIREREAEFDRILATVMFTDIVDFDRPCGAGRRPRLERAGRAPSRHREDVARTVPRGRGGHRRRRVLRDLRRAGPRGPLCRSDPGRSPAPRDRGPGRLPHR